MMSKLRQQVRETRKDQLRVAGFGFVQLPTGRWRVRTPYTEDASEPKAWLPKDYKHLTTAISAGFREIEVLRAMRDAKHNLSPEQETALKNFDAYKKESKE